ncbi:M20/M25/M40 family metallo-hydrolase [candidate division KSB1 bacterium]|nr:M20/M25/M40 family metallo-hydrolase [candidate division KSB1 bacterium]
MQNVQVVHRQVRSFFAKMALSFFILSLPLYAAPRRIVQQIISQIDTGQLNNYVRELSGEVPVCINGATYTISSRSIGFSGNTLALEYIKMKLTEFGLSPVEQDIGGTGVQNIYAEIIGTQFPEQRYILCAHFDSRPNADASPGADDNASGVAATLEAARILSRYELPYTVVFGFWNYEEYGAVGSQAYAAMAKARNHQILAIINVDMIGWDSNSDGRYNVYTNGAAESDAICIRFNQVVEDYQLNLNQLMVTNIGNCSDHYSFWQHGYPAVMLIEDYNQHADFNPYYHTRGDQFAMMHLDYFHNLSTLAIATLTEFATDVPSRPLAEGWPGGNNHLATLYESGLFLMNACWGQTEPARVKAGIQGGGQAIAFRPIAEAVYTDVRGGGLVHGLDVVAVFPSRSGYFLSDPVELLIKSFKSQRY